MKQKKTGIITFHIAHNYGAMLQAYALPTAVKKLGYDCEVIDYRFPYIDSWSRIEYLKDLLKKHGYIIGIAVYLKRLITGYYSRNNMHIRFDEFERNIIPHSTTIYRSKEELNNMPYDIILFGSDQIWNSALTNGIAEEYIGGFKCLPNTKKIAYAASCGTSDFQDESREVYGDLLKGFAAIGVREDTFRETLLSRGYRAECVLDPTLLLTAEEWKKIIPKEKKRDTRKYLLLYAFDEDEKVYDLTREYAKEHDLYIIVIAYAKKKEMHGMTVLTNCGPLDFLSLFENAEHIITTSFHGTVFSLVFHKNFHCIPHPKYRERTDSLLKTVGLEEHNVEELTELTDKPIDWDKVDKLLASKKKMSLAFLEKELV